MNIMNFIKKQELGVRNTSTTQLYSNSPSPMSTNNVDSSYQGCGYDNYVVMDHDQDLPVPLECKSSQKTDIVSEQSVRTQEKFPKEKRKTLIAFLLSCCSFILVTLSLALTHERLPDRDTYKPLPDIILDHVTGHDWAHDVSDILLSSMAMATSVVILFHRHRWIIMRRGFLILACLHLLRSITIYVTVLPVASYTYHCSPKSNSTSVLQVVSRVVQLLSGFGLPINGKHTSCGDYIYSGHTAGLVTCYLFIQEYTPRKLLILHWISWIASWIGVVMLLICRSHYTIDILVAYYVATRLFWIYHTLANNPELKVVQSDENGSRNNFLARVWWFPVFCYMERNVVGELPKQYSLPWSSK